MNKQEIISNLNARLSIVNLRQAIRGIIFNLIVSVPFIFLTLLPGASWWLAGRDKVVVANSLRWCVLTQAPAPRGVKIKDENVGLAIRRLGKDDCLIADKSQAVGKYALTDLAEGEALKPAHVSESAPAKNTTGGATIPVEVRTEHAESIKPGMQLAFVREKEGRPLMVPDMKHLTGVRKAAGFEVISITLSSKDASITTLTIAVEKKDMASIRLLANGQWRPVMLR